MHQLRNLHKLAAHYEFPNKDNLIRHRILKGILDNDLSETLQLESVLTLEAVDMALNSELVKKQINSSSLSSFKNFQISSRSSTLFQLWEKTYFTHKIPSKLCVKHRSI